MAAHRLTGLRFMQVFADLTPFFFAAAFVMIAAHYATSWMTIAPLLLLVRVVVAGILYLVVMKLAHAQILDECLHYVTHKHHQA